MRLQTSASCHIWLLLPMRNIPIFLWDRVQKKWRQILLAWKRLHHKLNPIVILETVTFYLISSGTHSCFSQNFAIQNHHCSRPVAKSVFHGPSHLSCPSHSIAYKIRSSWITHGPGFASTLFHFHPRGCFLPFLWD